MRERVNDGLTPMVFFWARPGSAPSHPRDHLFAYVLTVDRLCAGNRRMPEPATREDRLAPAKGVDAGALIGLGERIGGIGIDDPPQLCLAILGEPAIAGLLRQIAGFLWVAVEVEQLRHHAGVIDVFEPPLADHKG